MKRIDTLSMVATLITIVLLLCTIGDFLSLHDIRNDYVSKKVLDYLEIETSSDLPAWTGTELEWMSVTFSYFVRLFIIIVNLIILVRLRKHFRIVYEIQSSDQRQT